MKKRIVLREGQLVEMVNESARRVLQGLVNEGFLGSALANTANIMKIASMVPMIPAIMNGVEKVVSGGDNNQPRENRPSDRGALPYAQDPNYGQKPNYGQSEGMPKEVGTENIMKLYSSNPEAFATLAKDPALLVQIAGNPEMMDQITRDPSLLQMLVSNDAK